MNPFSFVDTAQELCRLYGWMSELANKIRNLRGDLSAEEAGKKCGVSRESFYRFERGGTTRLSTLRAIADGFGLNETQWTDLLVSWLKLEAGEDVDRVWIEPREGSSALHDQDSSHVGRAAMLFERLNPADRDEIFKAMQRPEVRGCLPAINAVWEKFEASRQLTLALPPQPAGQPHDPLHDAANSTNPASVAAVATLCASVPGAPSPSAPSESPPPAGGTSYRAARPSKKKPTP